MKITTGKGDRGTTEILFGKKVDKDSEIPEAVGTLDELNAFLGLAKTETKNSTFREILRTCQENLFLLGSEISCPPLKLKALKKRIGKEQIKWIEELIEDLGEKLGEGPTGFVIPGSDRFSALLEVSRCVARRAERKVVALCKKKSLKNPYVLVFLNRVSDLLWLLARKAERRTEVLQN